MQTKNENSEKKAFKEHAGVFVRGFLMGAADLVPGVSGGTIAFISGIYSRLLNSLAAFSQLQFWRDLLRFNIAACWRRADATFLFALLAGILTAFAALSRVLHYLLESKAHLLLGFFFGLVAASVVVVAARLRRPTITHFLLIAAAAAVTAWLVTLSPAGVGGSLPALFFGGVAAISAMLLPGISGSYILLILGLYPLVITALHERDWLPLVVLAGGCGIGIILFSRFLALLLRRWEAATLSVLIGVMVGAAPKLWPWKESGDGVKIILQKNVAPAEYTASSDVGFVLLLAFVGALLVWGVDRLSRRR